MAKKTLHDIETELDAIRTEARATATRLKSGGDYTPQGVTETFTRYEKHGNWSANVEELAAAASAAIDNASRQRDELKAAMVTPAGTVEEQLLAEMRYQRRSQRVSAALDAGAGDLVDLIANADPADLPLLYERAVDHYTVKGGEAGKAGMAMLDHALKERNPDYAAAASTAGRAESTRHVIAEKLKFVREAVTNPDASDPTPGGVATVSVTAAGEDVAGLAA
ncbi:MULTISPECIES: hypothetical protein [unclassified Dietzia]|uniref:hypothetical protein n=1 Tax=unclassified Dietzia TaxID=2617939 RepID=UPI000D221F84|nr:MULTISPECIES: hypothetical protein [unclassified Dietzia]AVZ39081.1 hypothetical protein CT688_05950 [Dietzia sp. JS16-p6b]QGW24269.1 hypothetical protein GJR88_01899 [Dietzia sp. DQ12-45-1b]